MRDYDNTVLSLSTEIELLKKTVTSQQKILKKVNDDEIVSQVWTLYKEIIDYYAQSMQMSEDIIIIWSDDNWDNIQQSLMLNKTDNSDGSEIYYHFDLISDSHAHKWVWEISAILSVILQNADTLLLS